MYQKVSTRRWQFLLPLGGILILGINLRPAITAVGPVLPEIGRDLQLGPSELGLLGALPIATFGIFATVVQRLIQRYDPERVTMAAMLVLTGATVLRSLPGPNANLWVGTILIGAAIAVGNVIAPVLVKRSFPTSTSTITAAYVAVLGVCAGLAAALSAPLAEASMWGWRFALGIWALVTVVAAAYWTWQSVRTPSVSGGGSIAITGTSTQLWRSGAAWKLSIYMGAQSSVFYVSLTWLPTVEQHLGFSAVTSGWHMFALQIAGVAGNLLAPLLMRIGNDERFAAALPGVLFLASLAGLYWFPKGALVWVSILGLGTGSTFVVALSLMASRAKDVIVAGRVSAMAQGVGYTIAAMILYLAGAAAGVSILAVLAVLAGAGVLVGAIGLATGRNHAIGP